MRSAACFAAIVAIALPSFAAEIEEKPWPKGRGLGALEIGFSAGGLKISDAHQLGAVTLFPPGLKSRLPVYSAGPEFGLRAGVFAKYYGLEVDASLAPLSVVNEGEALVVPLRGHAIVQLPIGPVTLFGLGGGGFIGVSSPNTVVGDDFDTAFHFGGGFKYAINEAWHLRFELRDTVSTRFSNTFGAHHLGGAVGLSFRLAPLYTPAPDEDDDGVPDTSDACPRVASDTKDGCPPPPPDADGDGRPDDKDQCPNEAAKTLDGCPVKDSDADGVIDGDDRCPAVAAPTKDGCPLPDGDEDGVPDALDRCPTVAGTTASGCLPDADSDGVADVNDKCPEIAGNPDDGCPKDGDGDGVADEKDKCPEVAAKTADGCPAGDTDKDGLTDDKDACPAEAESPNGYLDEDGCADALPKELAKTAGVMSGIAFGKGEAVLLKSSEKALAPVLKAFAAVPELKLEIVAHVDGKKGADAAKALSEERAKAVRDYLVKKGAPAERIETFGAGNLQPIADDRTEAGRAKNQRIILRWKK